MYAHTFCLKTLFQAKEISNLIYKYVAMYSSAKQEGQGLAGVLRNNQEAQRMWTPSNSVPLWSSLSQLVMWLQKKQTVTNLALLWCQESEYGSFIFVTRR